jgi:3-oxoacyl-[acyl-carrier protein] reductase
MSVSNNARLLPFASGMLRGKCVVVTGSTRGIGLGIAEVLAMHGADLLLNGLGDCAEIERVRQSLAEAYGVLVSYSAADMAKPAEIEDMIAQATRDLGGVDILVNNAGITKDGLFVRMSDEDWDNVIEVNLTAVFRLTRELTHPMMRRRFGRIVNITSVVGVTGNPGQANYCASKAGMIGFSKSLAQEIATRNVTVNCVAPGFIESAMTGKLNDKQKEGIMSAIPMRRMGSGAEVASAVAYLASNEAGYVTGQTIHVNGGMAMV